MSDETKTSDGPNGGAGEAANRPEDQAAAAAPTQSAEELAAALAGMRDQYLRAIAEADNTRKRAEREIADARVYGVAALARDLLSVADNLARALEALSPDVRAGLGEGARHLVEGVEITQKELHAALQRCGVKPIVVEPGSGFDPNLHQAASQIPSDKPSGTVVEVLQGGWVIGERVLRAATVVVSAGRDGEGAGAPSPGATVDTKV
jgi:molecular chaperone GrpE